MKYIIRQAAAEDEKRIRELYTEMLQTVYSKEDAEAYKDKDLCGFWTGDENRIFVAEDRAVVGFLSLEVHHENKDYIYLDDFAVTSKYRNKGIGSALLKAAESYAREINLKRILMRSMKTLHNP